MLGRKSMQLDLMEETEGWGLGTSRVVCVNMVIAVGEDESGETRNAWKQNLRGVPW